MTLAAMAWEDLADVRRPRFGVAPGHDRRALERPLLAARDPRADKEQPLGFQVTRAAGRGLGNTELPPSIRMSPGVSKGTSSLITSSTGCPALTMIMIFRGGESNT